MSQPRSPRISSHAIDRYLQRVDPGASRLEARLALQQFAARGRHSQRPRHWMRHSPPAPGARCLYWAQRPGICLIVNDDVVVTVLTRDVCRGRRRSRHLTSVPRPTETAARWRWNGDLEEAA